MALTLLACVSTAAAPGEADVHYHLTATFANGEVTLEHLLVNFSGSSLCFFPDQVDVANANFFDASGHPIENIATSGVITVRTTMYISYADQLPRAFWSTDKQDSIFKTPYDAARATQVGFELFAYDCRQLVSKDYVRVRAVWHKSVKVGVTRPAS